MTPGPEVRRIAAATTSMRSSPAIRVTRRLYAAPGSQRRLFGRAVAAAGATLGRIVVRQVAVGDCLSRYREA